MPQLLGCGRSSPGTRPAHIVRMLRNALVLAALSLVGVGCAAPTEEDEGTQAGATSTQLGVEDFCGTMLEIGSRAPTKIGDSEIRYAWSGRVDAIGRDEVSYSYLGRVSSIGDAQVGYGYASVMSVGDMHVTRSYAGRVTSVGDAQVAWSFTGRPTSIGRASVDYGFTGEVRRVGSADLNYSLVRTVSEENRFALCLAVYLSAVASR